VPQGVRMKKFIKWLFGLIVSIVIIVLIAAIVLVNLTPRKLGFETMQVEGSTVEDLGLADTKIWTIYKNFNALSEVKEETVVTNGFDDDVEKANANTFFKDSSLEGKDDYKSLFLLKNGYTVSYSLELTDKTIAYVVDNVIEHATSDHLAAKYLQDVNLDVEEITISKTEDGTGILRLVSEVDLDQYEEEIKSSLGFANRFLKVPEELYLVSNFTFTVDENGKMQATPVSLFVDGKDEAVANAVLKIALNKMGVTAEDVNSKLGEVVTTVISNMGQIGTAKTTENNVVSDLAPSYGMGGVSNHKLQFVTYNEATSLLPNLVAVATQIGSLVGD
jgi:hypothetical protein